MGTKYEVNTDGKVYAASASLADKMVITSTDISENKAPVVVMTSDTTPSPYVTSASSVFSASYQAWQAFDNSTSTDWATNGVTTNFWVKIDFGSAFYADRAEVKCRDSDECPNDWRIEGSNDDAAWTVLYSQASGMPQTTTTVNFTKTGTFRYYRMFAVTGGGTNPGMSIFNIQSSVASYAAPFSDNQSGDLVIKTGGNDTKIKYQTTSSSGELKTAMNIKDGFVGYGTESPLQRVSIVGNTLASSTIASTMYSADNSIGHLSFNKSRGTEASPTAILTNDFIADWRFGGQYSSTPGDLGLGLQIFARATENWSGSARGSQVFISSSKTGTVTTDTALLIDGSNNVRVYEGLTVSALGEGRVESGATGVLSSVAPTFTKAVATGGNHALNSTYATVPNCSITLTTAGTYRLFFSARGAIDDKNEYCVFRMYNSTLAAAVADTEAINKYDTSGTGGQASCNGEAFITITGSTTIVLQGWASKATGGEAVSNTDGKTYIGAHRI
jgi:hypothetical protein